MRLRTKNNSEALRLDSYAHQKEPTKLENVICMHIATRYNLLSIGIMALYCIETNPHSTTIAWKLAGNNCYCALLGSTMFLVFCFYSKLEGMYNVDPSEVDFTRLQNVVPKLIFQSLKILK